MNSADIPLGRLYGDLCDLWPFISDPQEYTAEAAHWQTILQEKLGDGRHRLLELGVGGGHNLSHFAAGHDVVAVDISERMIGHAKELHPSVKFLIGDMRSVRLGQQFDAVLIHDAISYMLTESDLRATLSTAAAHLRQGGVAIFAPDHFKETFAIQPQIFTSSRTIESTRVTYTEYHYDLDPSDTTTECIMMFLIHNSGELKIEFDRHIFGLFPRDTWIAVMSAAGFTPEVRSFRLGPEGTDYTLLVGARR